VIVWGLWLTCRQCLRDEQMSFKYTSWAGMTGCVFGMFPLFVPLAAYVVQSKIFISSAVTRVCAIVTGLSFSERAIFSVNIFHVF